MPEPMHSVTKTRKCDIEGCGADAERSVSGKKVEKAGLKLSSDASKSAHLCRQHYRDFKKRTKKDRTFERMGW
jgi:hypothetical protein